MKLWGLGHSGACYEREFSLGDYPDHTCFVEPHLVTLSAVLFSILAPKGEYHLKSVHFYSFLDNGSLGLCLVIQHARIDSWAWSVLDRGPAENDFSP